MEKGSSWRPNDWSNPYVNSDAIQAWDVPEAYGSGQDEEYWIYEAGAVAMLEAISPRLQTIYAQLCGIRIEKGKTEWYSALDASMDFLTNLLYKEGA